MRILIAAVAAWCLPILGHADDILFESATLGPTGITLQQQIDEQIQGTNVNQSVFVGARFEIATPANVSRIGGHFTADSAGGDFFGAIVQLSGPDDLPDSADLSTVDVLGSTLLTFPSPSADVYGELEVSLDPGWYGVVFGSGLFGASGAGAALRNNPTNDASALIGWQSGIGWGPRDLTPGRYFSVVGRVIPEPSSAVLAIAFAAMFRPRTRCE